MTLTIPPELEAKIKQRAQPLGLSAEGWLRRMVERELDSPELADDRAVSETIREIWADMPDHHQAHRPA